MNVVTIVLPCHSICRAGGEAPVSSGGLQRYHVFVVERAPFERKKKHTKTQQNSYRFDNCCLFSFCIVLIYNGLYICYSFFFFFFFFVLVLLYHDLGKNSKMIKEIIYFNPVKIWKCIENKKSEFNCVVLWLFMYARTGGNGAEKHFDNHEVYEVLEILSGFFVTVERNIWEVQISTGIARNFIRFVGNVEICVGIL